VMRALRCSSLHPNLDHLDTESLAEVSAAPPCGIESVRSDVERPLREAAG
jgi:hypothetical protein